MAAAPLTLERDITRAVELLENLQKSGEVDTTKVEALKKVGLCGAVFVFAVLGVLLSLVELYRSARNRRCAGTKTGGTPPTDQTDGPN